MYNRIELIGHVGRDIEVKQISEDRCVGRFSVATSEAYKDKNGEWQDNTEWHTVICWRKSAEQLQKITKGKLMFIEGKMTYRSYQNDSNETKYVSEVICNQFRILDKKKVEAPFPEEAPY